MSKVGQGFASMVLVAFAMLPTVRAQVPAKFPDMSADMVSSSGGMNSQGKFYTSKGRIRLESSRGTIMIMNPAEGTGWLLNTRRKTAMDMSATMKMTQEKLAASSGMNPEDVLLDPNNPCAALKGSTCKKLGSETVNGRQTTKWEIHETDGQTINVWVDPKLWLAVKTQTPNYTGEFRNIQEGPQPESLFEVPADYRKVAGPGTAPPGAPRQ